jgi:hypothetical protein
MWKYAIPRYEIPYTKHRQAIVGSLATTTRVHSRNQNKKGTCTSGADRLWGPWNKSCKTALGLGSLMRTRNTIYYLALLSILIISQDWFKENI